MQTSTTKWRRSGAAWLPSNPTPRTSIDYDRGIYSLLQLHTNRSTTTGMNVRSNERNRSSEPFNSSAYNEYRSGIDRHNLPLRIDRTKSTDRLIPATRQITGVNFYIKNCRSEPSTPMKIYKRQQSCWGPVPSIRTKKYNQQQVEELIDGPPQQQLL